MHGVVWHKLADIIFLTFAQPDIKIPLAVQKAVGGIQRKLIVDMRIHGKFKTTDHGRRVFLLWCIGTFISRRGDDFIVILHDDKIIHKGDETSGTNIHRVDWCKQKRQLHIVQRFRVKPGISDITIGIDIQLIKRRLFKGVAIRQSHVHPFGPFGQKSKAP